MSRIERRFAALREEGRAGLVTYLTAGDPDPTTAAPSGIPTQQANGTFGPPFTTDATGGNFTDLTWDDTPGSQPDQTHPDQHAIATTESVASGGSGSKTVPAPASISFSRASTRLYCPVQ